MKINILKGFSNKARTTTTTVVKKNNINNQIDVMHCVFINTYNRYCENHDILKYSDYENLNPDISFLPVL